MFETKDRPKRLLIGVSSECDGTHTHCAIRVLGEKKRKIEIGNVARLTWTTTMIADER